MVRSISGINIVAIAAALPERSLSLEDLAPQFGEREVKRIICSTGIESVRIAGELQTSDLCEIAIRSLFEQTGTDPCSIDAIVLVTQTPDYLMPPTSALLQHRLGMSNSCLVFDINSGCSGYIYGLYQAAMLIGAGGCKKVVLCSGDVTSKLLNAEDRQVRMVFGDAGTATLIEQGKGHLKIVLKTDGGGATHLHTGIKYGNTLKSSAEIAHLHMNGIDIMGFALKVVPPLIDELLTAASMSKADVSLFAFHQANGFMLNYLTKALGIEKARLPIRVKDVGNTGPASIPLLLSMISHETALLCGNALLCGFGVGLSWGAALVDLSNTLLIEPVDIPNFL